MRNLTPQQIAKLEVLRTQLVILKNQLTEAQIALNVAYSNVNKKNKIKEDIGNELAAVWNEITAIIESNGQPT